MNRAHLETERGQPCPPGDPKSQGADKAVRAPIANG